MYRHISIFTLKDKTQINCFQEMLKEVGKQCPSIINSEVGLNLSKQPEQGPDFGDIIQIVDFETLDALQAYPATPEHLHLLKDGPEMVKVTAIDYQN